MALGRLRTGDQVSVRLARLIMALMTAQPLVWCSISPDAVPRASAACQDTRCVFHRLRRQPWRSTEAACLLCRLVQVWSYGFTTIGRSAAASTHSSSSSTSGSGGKDGVGPDVVEGLGSGMVQQVAAGAGGSGSAATASSGGGGSSTGGRRQQQPGGGLQVLMRGPGGHSRYQMAGLGFGLPLSRLYARYFGEPMAAHCYRSCVCSGGVCCTGGLRLLAEVATACRATATRAGTATPPRICICLP